MSGIKDAKVAIVADWLIGGGAERVVLELHQMFPAAPVFTSYCTPAWRSKLDDKVVTGYLQRWPFGKLRKFLPVLRIWWFGRLKFDDYDLVISVSGNGESFGVKTPAQITHINYCNTPTHYYWRHYDHYLARPGFGIFDPLARLGLRLLIGPLRRWDYRAAQQADVVIANSTHIQSDIQQYYGRESIVIHPPVDITRFQSPKSELRTPNSGYVTMGRLATMKRVDIIVEAATKLNVPLKVIGRGPDLERLKKLAGPSVSFLQDVSDEEMPGQLASAEAFIFASYEDFGIAPVEALAAATPVIAYKAGGATDYVIPGETGEFFAEQTADSLISALQSFDPNRYSTSTLQSKAAEFSPAVFMHHMEEIINKTLQKR